jgi:hypothetical protein
MPGRALCIFACGMLVSGGAIPMWQKLADARMRNHGAGGIWCALYNQEQGR